MEKIFLKLCIIYFQFHINFFSNNDTSFPLFQEVLLKFISIFLNKKYTVLFSKCISIFLNKMYTLSFSNCISIFLNKMYTVLRLSWETDWWRVLEYRSLVFLTMITCQTIARDISVGSSKSSKWQCRWISGLCVDSEDTWGKMLCHQIKSEINFVMHALKVSFDFSSNCFPNAVFF